MVAHDTFRIGVVTAINNGSRMARVKFNDLDMTSDWLYVLDNHPHIPDYDPAPQRTEYEAGGAGDPAFASHKHDLIIKPWMPLVGDVVACGFIDVHDGTGFVLGRIGP